tara:strand:+ start:894 stop:1073 length:180 start_codon:yes stop_codon:yes gene_type:complete
MVSQYQVEWEETANSILNQPTLSDDDMVFLTMYKKIFIDQAEWIDEALALFDTKKEPPA